MDYPIPEGAHAIQHGQLDLRPDDEVDRDLTDPKSITNEKNIFFFWHAGFSNMHGYTRRNIRAWHRRFSRSGWVIRVLDRVPGSPVNVANFLDVNDPKTFPRSFIDGTIGGDYAPQHTSDLVRWPLLLKYGGVYADVGLMQIGDLDALWSETVGDPKSPFEVLSYNMGGIETRALTNYFLASGRNNPLFARCHKLLLKLWSADGGKASTEGMHISALLKGTPLLKASAGTSFEENGKVYGPEEISKMLSDYIVQGQVMTLVQGLIDEEDGWNGPEYTAKHIFAMDYMVGSQLINEFTSWNGPRAFELMSLSMLKEDEAESEDQKKAREIVEACLTRSFGFKLAHGLIIRVLGQTLGSLWRKHDGSGKFFLKKGTALSLEIRQSIRACNGAVTEGFGSFVLPCQPYGEKIALVSVCIDEYAFLLDDIPGTYAHWLRRGMIYCCPDALPPRLEFEVIEPYKRGPLLNEG